MTLTAQIVLAAAVVASNALHAQECAPVGTTHISLVKDGAGARASYVFETPVSCLRLYDRGDVRTLTWQLHTPGASLSADGKTVHFAVPSASLSVHLRPFDRDGQIDRVYSPLIAFGDGKAVAVYTNYLMPEIMTRGVFFQFDGFAPSAPLNPVGPQRLGPGATYMVVGAPRVERRGKVALVLDTAMSGWLLASVIRNIGEGEAALRAVRRDLSPLSYLVTYTEPALAGMNWRGDVLDRLVRLNFMGEQWQEEDRKKNVDVARFVLHELVHTLGAPVQGPQVPGAMSLGEGMAEAGALALVHEVGHLSAAELDEAVDTLLTLCHGLSGATLEAKEKLSQRAAPYTCGPALQFLLIKASNARVSNAPALSRILLRHAALRERGWSSLLAAATAAPHPNRAALSTLRLMITSQISWDAGVQALVQAGLLRRRTDAELANPRFSRVFARASLMPILAQHCKQSYGYYDQGPVYVLDAPAPGCSAVRDKFRLAVLNGHRLDSSAYLAYMETTRRCTAGLPLELEDDRGIKFTLACTAPVDAVTLYAMDEIVVRSGGTDSRGRRD